MISRGLGGDENSVWLWSCEAFAAKEMFLLSLILAGLGYFALTVVLVSVSGQYEEEVFCITVLVVRFLICVLVLPPSEEGIPLVCNRL